MSYLTDEIADVQRRLEAIDQAIETRVRKIQDDATTAIVQAMRDSDDEKTGLRVKLAHLIAAAGGSGPVERPKTIEADASLGAAPSTRRTAGETILEELAKQGPLSSNALDKAVMAEGWSKFAAEKAKVVQKKNGLIINEKRIWSLTPEGQAKVSGTSSEP